MIDNMESNYSTEKLTLIVGFSASGKDTLARSLQEKGYHSVVSCTTRPMRPGEVDGVDYNFHSEDDFLNKVHTGEIIEYRVYNTEYKGKKAIWYYGTESNQIVSDKKNVAVVDFDGVKFFKNKTDYDITSVFLKTTLKTRRDRCIKRGDYDEVEFNRRFQDDERKTLCVENWDGIDEIIYADGTPREVLTAFERMIESD